jgi:ribosomal protein S18 acetylase RimI-like enzyme
MEFRRATPDDTESILQLWRASDATRSTTDEPEYVRRATDHPAAVFVLAVVDGQIVGSIIGTFDGWRGNMYRLVVHRTHRRKGVARALVRQVEVVLGEWGARRITALVEHDRPSAARFWEAVGYPRDEHVARHVGALDVRAR